jgi:hypothetical protein
MEIYIKNKDINFDWTLLGLDNCDMTLRWKHGKIYTKRNKILRFLYKRTNK